MTCESQVIVERDDYELRFAPLTREEYESGVQPEKPESRVARKAKSSSREMFCAFYSWL